MLEGCRKAVEKDCAGRIIVEISLKAASERNLEQNVDALYCRRNVMNECFEGNLSEECDE